MCICVVTVTRSCLLELSKNGLSCVGCRQIAELFLTKQSMKRLI